MNERKIKQMKRLYEKMNNFQSKYFIAGVELSNFYTNIIQDNNGGSI